MTLHRGAEESQLQLLLTALNDDNARNRCAITSVLNRFKGASENAIPSLTNLLTDESPSVRKAACKTLGLFKPRNVNRVEPISDLLNDRSVSVRIQALKSLACFGRDAVHVTPRIQKKLDSSHIDELFYAAHALALIAPGSANTSTKLTKLRSHENKTVRRWCRFASDATFDARKPRVVRTRDAYLCVLPYPSTSFRVRFDEQVEKTIVTVVPMYPDEEAWTSERVVGMQIRQNGQWIKFHPTKSADIIPLDGVDRFESKLDVDLDKRGTLIELKQAKKSLRFEVTKQSSTAIHPRFVDLETRRFCVKSLNDACN